MVKLRKYKATLLFLFNCQNKLAFIPKAYVEIKRIKTYDTVYAFEQNMLARL